MATSEAFIRFGLAHTLGVAFVALGVLLSAWLARRPAWRRATGAALLAALVIFTAQSYWYRRHTLTVETALPLHLCDLILGLCLLASARIARGQKPGRQVTDLLYYWGFGLSIHALLTPDIEESFPAPRFLEFFFGHGLIFWALGCAAGVQGLSLSRRAALRCWIWLNAWILGVGWIDWVTGWNYGYLMRKPVNGSVLDLLGPWPVYVLAADVLAGLQFALIWGLLQWVFDRRERRL